MSKRIAYILRGLPGSGKSTIARELAAKADAVICSTDNYFYDADGNYTFAPDLLSVNHKKNKEEFERACKLGREVVICDNTNTRKWEYDYYVKVAEQYGYQVHILIVGNPKDPAHVEECIKRNIHGVPAETIRRMSDRFEL